MWKPPVCRPLQVSPNIETFYEFCSTPATASEGWRQRNPKKNPHARDHCFRVPELVVGLGRYLQTKLSISEKSSRSFHCMEKKFSLFSKQNCYGFVWKLTPSQFFPIYVAKCVRTRSNYKLLFANFQLKRERKIDRESPSQAYRLKCMYMYVYSVRLCVRG